MNIAIIPARGGSKRIPRKNIREFFGKPMVAYAIDAAKRAGLFEHIIVSTDDQEIAEQAEKWGAELPFMRPHELADDHTGTIPVVAHAIRQIKARSESVDYVCCIYPTVPFLQVGDLLKAFQRLKNEEAEFCFPVAEFPSAIQRALKFHKGNRVEPFYPEYESVRTQDLESAYFDAGQFYWGKAEAWLKNSHIHSHGVGHVIPHWRAVDIDSEDDWKRAELIFEAYEKEIEDNNSG